MKGKALTASLFTYRRKIEGKSKSKSSPILQKPKIMTIMIKIFKGVELTRVTNNKYVIKKLLKQGWEQKQWK